MVTGDLGKRRIRIYKQIWATGTSQLVPRSINEERIGVFERFEKRQSGCSFINTNNGRNKG